jgi:tripartite-type tricarboxylate transporter receptor subunit TctC
MILQLCSSSSALNMGARNFKERRMRQPFRFALAAALICVAAGAHAYPDRPLTLVVPFPAGGPTDIVARVVAQKLSSVLGQAVVIENRSGAAGQMGAASVAKAKPDGYTIGVVTVSTHGTAPNLYSTIPYDALKDFTPISNIAGSPSVIAVHPSVPARTLAELVALVRANSGKFAYANAGAGGIGDLGMTWFMQIVGGSMLSVSYKGSAPALTDVVAGQVPVVFDNFPSTLVYVRAGKLRPLAITGKSRNAAAPDLPTFAEAGYPEFDVPAWYGLAGPAGLPPEVVQKLYEAVTKSLADPAVAARLADAGAFLIGNRPEEFAAQIRDEVAKWSRVIKAAGIKLQ